MMSKAEELLDARTKAAEKLYMSCHGREFVKEVFESGTTDGELTGLMIIDDPEPPKGYNAFQIMRVASLEAMKRWRVNHG